MQFNIRIEICCARNEVPQQFAIELAKRNIDIIIMWKKENCVIYVKYWKSFICGKLLKKTWSRSNSCLSIVKFSILFRCVPPTFSGMHEHLPVHIKHRHFGWGGNAENEITCILIKNYWQTVWFINVAHCIPFPIPVCSTAYSYILTECGMFLKELHCMQVLRIWQYFVFLYCLIITVIAPITWYLINITESIIHILGCW